MLKNLFNKKPAIRIHQIKKIPRPRSIKPLDYDMSRARKLRETEVENTKLRTDYNDLEHQTNMQINKKNDEVDLLKRDLKLSENQREEKNKRIALLNVELEKKQKEFRSLNSEFEKQQGIIKSKNDDIEELQLRNFRLSEFEILNIPRKVRILKGYKKELRKLIIKTKLKGNFERFEKKSTPYLLDLAHLDNPNIPEPEKESKPKLSFEDEDPEFKNYIKSELCFCGKPKRVSAIGCQKCRKEANKIRNRLQIPMRESWKKVLQNL